MSNIKFKDKANPAKYYIIKEDVSESSSAASSHSSMESQRILHTSPKKAKKKFKGMVNQMNKSRSNPAINIAKLDELSYKESEEGNPTSHEFETVSNLSSKKRRAS